MKILIFLLLTFNLYGQEKINLMRCFYLEGKPNALCGNYADNDPVLVAEKVECVIDGFYREPTAHLKLKADGKVECPPVIDPVRKKEAEDKEKALKDKEDKKEAAKQWLIDNEATLSPELVKIKEALGL